MANSNSSPPIKKEARTNFHAHRVQGQIKRWGVVCDDSGERTETTLSSPTDRTKRSGKFKKEQLDRT